MLLSGGCRGSWVHTRPRRGDTITPHSICGHQLGVTQCVLQAASCLPPPLRPCPMGMSLCRPQPPAWAITPLAPHTPARGCGPWNCGADGNCEAASTRAGGRWSVAGGRWGARMPRRPAAFQEEAGGGCGWSLRVLTGLGALTAGSRSGQSLPRTLGDHMRSEHLLCTGCSPRHWGCSTEWGSLVTIASVQSHASLTAVPRCPPWTLNATWTCTAGQGRCRPQRQSVCLRPRS